MIYSTKESKMSKKNKTPEVEVDTTSQEPVVETAPSVDLVAEVDRYKQLAMRTQADFDNYRKRTMETSRRSREDGIIDTVLEMLPILDNLDRAVASITDESSRQGVVMIVKQFNQVLTSIGVQAIDALNQPFDPNYHNAVMSAEVEGVEAGIVVDVFQTGYTYHDKVIRPTMVKVSQ